MSMIIDALPLLFDLLHRMAIKRGKRRLTSYFEWTERMFPGRTKDLLSFVWSYYWKRINSESFKIPLHPQLHIL